VWDEQDTLLAQYNFSTPILAGETLTATQTVTLPAVPAGDYYILVFTDFNNEQMETDESNNV